MKSVFRRFRYRRAPSVQQQPFFQSVGEGEYAASEGNTFFSPAATGVQTKLTIGQPNDKYEREADAMADQVVSQQHAGTTTQQRTPNVQAMCADCKEKGVQRMADEEESQVQKMEEEEVQMKQEEEPEVQMVEEEEVQAKQEEEPEVQLMEEEEVQAKEDEEPEVQAMEEEEIQTKPQLMHKSTNGRNVGTSTLATQLSNSRGSGRPMAAGLQAKMGNAFGQDFGGVRVHTGSRAAEMNKGLRARAFTHGSDIYFNNGEYRPESTAGQRLLAHELTHVVQQGGGNKMKKESLVQKQENDEMTASSSRPLDHFRIELKAWIPHNKVVDPEAPAHLTALSLRNPLSYILNHQSYYRGDGHANYGGSFRVLSVVEFDWNGSNISNLTHGDDYGTTHRDYAYTIIPTIIGSGSGRRITGIESATATSATNGSRVLGTSFELGIASANPVVMGPAPNIDSDVIGTFISPGTSPKLSLNFNTDGFPSHGIKVVKNGTVLDTRIVNDASTLSGLGISGLTVISAGLAWQGNDGSYDVPI